MKKLFSKIATTGSGCLALAAAFVAIAGKSALDLPHSVSDCDTDDYRGG